MRIVHWIHSWCSTSGIKAAVRNSFSLVIVVWAWILSVITYVKVKIRCDVFLRFVIKIPITSRVCFVGAGLKC